MEVKAVGVTQFNASLGQIGEAATTSIEEGMRAERPGPLAPVATRPG